MTCMREQSNMWLNRTIGYQKLRKCNPNELLNQTVIANINMGKIAIFVHDEYKS